MGLLLSRASVEAGLCGKHQPDFSQEYNHCLCSRKPHVSNPHLFITPVSPVWIDPCDQMYDCSATLLEP